MSRFKKTILIISIFIILVLIFSQQTLGIRILFPSWLVGTLRDFLADESHLSIEPYKNGTIILIKPVATGVGDGRYEAGDIVEIRDGWELYQRFGPDYPFLGKEERTRLLPVYYDGKLTKEQKKMLTESEENKRREYGLDYTQVLSDRQILKVRNHQKLDKLPEVDLSHIIQKTADQASAVKVPRYLSEIEKARNQIKGIVQTIIPSTRAQSESVKTVDTGGFADYSSLNAWEGGEQDNLTISQVIAVAKCRHATATSTADTTAVYITGWTTSATYYVKVWTDPDEGYRHNGVWSEDKYRLETSGVTIAYRTNAFTRTEGLQIHMVNTGANAVGIYKDGSGEHRISNCIVKGDAGSNGYGIRAMDNDKIWNSIIYNCTKVGIYPGETEGAYIYNSTIYNCGLEGIGSITGGVVNCAVFGNDVDFSGTTNIDHCASDDGGGTNEVTPSNWHTVFADYPNGDFHLIYTDTDLKDSGTNDPGSGLFSDDIDGQSRSGTWDIGADQYQATEIYRSVGPNNSSALANGWGGDTLSIFGSTATFSVGLANNVGVGDVIVYTATEGTTNNATNSVAFIHGRTSSTVYTVKDVTGKMASSTMAATSRWAVYRAYTSLVGAESGNENNGIEDSLEDFESWSGGKNLASSTERWNIACYADAVDSYESTIEGWTTTADNYIKIYTPTKESEVGTSQRHNGKWNDNKYRLEVSDEWILTVREENVRIEGLQIRMTSVTTSGRYVIYYQNIPGSADLRLSHSIIRGVGSTSYSGHIGINLFINGSGTLRMWNNIIYDFNGNSGAYGMELDDADFTYYIYNNTVYNCYIGYLKGAGTGIAKNNISYNNTDNWNGTFTSSTNNLSGPTQTDAPGSNPRNGYTVNFADQANDDFHLMVSDTGARNAGTDLSNDANLAFNDDIDGEERPGGGGGWDIGADELKSTTLLNAPLTQKFTDGLVGHWTFNGEDMDWASTTAEALDRSGNSNNGDVKNGAKPTDGKIGQALEFDGSNDYIDTGFETTYTTSDSFTYMAWYKTNAGAGHQPVIGAIAEKGTDDPGITMEAGSGVYTDKFRGFVRDDGGVNIGNNLVSTIVVTDNQWHHLVLVRDVSIDKIKLYVDGAEEDSETDPTTFSITLTGTGGNAFIGSYNDRGNVAGVYMNGLIDEVRIYNRALSADEIMDLYQAGAKTFQVNTPITQKYTSGLVGHWTFNGEDMDWSTNTAYDRSGQGNNGTMTNMATTTSPTDGQVGQALEFDGGDDYVDVPYDSSLDFGTGDFAISVWFKPSALESDTHVLLGKPNYETNGYIAVQNSANFGFYICGEGSLVDADSVFSIEEWTHAVVTRTGTNVSMYVDGSFKDSDTSSCDITNSEPLNIGMYEAGSMWPINGLIDEVRIYDRALSAEEIEDLYQAGARKFQVK